MLRLLHDDLVLHVELKRETIPSFERYPFSIPTIKGLPRIEFHPEVTVIVGENGAGKSTFVEAIAVAAGFNPEGGNVNNRFLTAASHSELHRHVRVARRGSLRRGFFLRAESFFNLATNVDQLGGADSYGGKSLHEQSHGESFLALMQNKFGAAGLYVLDEPEAALSPRNQLLAVDRIRELTAKGAQFLIATHSPIFTAYPDAFVYQFDSQTDPPVQRIRWQDADHVRVLRHFLGDSCDEDDGQGE